ncbi:NIPA-like protein 2 isoform X1 [Pseudorca crassidens]|uniref:NIPA-like protein 2 isoform X1 n=1 Tax=Pseudorca crassidens TaxID=82174 RepID=UPI00352E0450
MRSEPRRPGRPQSAGLLREPGAARGREPGGPGAPASPGHRAGSGCGAARARPPQGAPPSWRRAVRPGREEAGARVPARGARANGGASAQGPRSRRLGRPGRAVPEPHVRGAGRRQWLPVGRLVPPEPDSPFWSFAGHFRKLGNQRFPKYSEIFASSVGAPRTPKATLQERAVVERHHTDGCGRDRKLCSLWICPHYSHCSIRLYVCYRYDTGICRNIFIGELCSKYNSGYLCNNSTVFLCWLAVHDLRASLTVISVKAVSGMIAFSVTDKMQLTYPIFYIMFIIMIASCVFQVKLLNQATKLYNTATVVPINHTFFTISAIIAGIIFYKEFLGATFLTIFIYLFGCFLSFLGVVLVTRNRGKERLPQSYIDIGHVPGKQTLDKIQPDSNSLSYGTLPDGSDSTKSPSGEKKEV